MRDTSITKGTKIIVRAQGCVMYGTVLDANNWGTKDAPNWYIEYTIDESRSLRPSRFSGSYGYWKQGVDGGTVEIEGGTDVTTSDALSIALWPTKGGAS